MKVRLINEESGEINEHEIFMGDLPLMTDTGSFVINGAERVIVSQLVRSPGIYYGIAHDKLGKKLYSCTVIPNRGAWLEYETDSNDVFYVRVDRTRKVPVTVLIRALGVGTNQEIVNLFGDEPMLEASFGKDTATNSDEGLLELYKKIRPGEPPYVDNARSLLESMFFDARRYDLAKVGRYKFNKKLHFRSRIAGHVWRRTSWIPPPAKSGGCRHGVTKEMAMTFQNAGVPFCGSWRAKREDTVKVLSNLMVDLKTWVDCDPHELGIKEDVYYPKLKELMEQYTDHDELLAAIRRTSMSWSRSISPERISLPASTTACIWRPASAMTMTSTIWATAASVRWASCCRTSTASVSPAWREWCASA